MTWLVSGVVPRRWKKAKRPDPTLNAMTKRNTANPTNSHSFVFPPGPQCGPNQTPVPDINAIPSAGKNRKHKRNAVVYREEMGYMNVKALIRTPSSRSHLLGHITIFTSAMAIARVRITSAGAFVDTRGCASQMRNSSQF